MVLLRDTWVLNSRDEFSPFRSVHRMMMPVGDVWISERLVQLTAVGVVWSPGGSFVTAPRAQKFPWKPWPVHAREMSGPAKLVPYANGGDFGNTKSATQRRWGYVVAALRSRWDVVHDSKAAVFKTGECVTVPGSKTPCFWSIQSDRTYKASVYSGLRNHSHMTYMNREFVRSLDTINLPFWISRKRVNIV